MLVRRLGSALAAAALLLFGLHVQLGTPASADDALFAPLPATVSADALPTVQINGVVWRQAISGTTVYAGGQFTSARPAGSPAGTNETPRSNLLSYNLQTGVLNPSFAPTLNGKVSDLAVTPDGTKLVIVGDFTVVNGQTRNRVAIFNLPAGTLSSTAPSSNGNTKAVAVTNSAIYVGGYFSYLNSSARARLGGFDINTGATLPFTVPVDDGQVQSIVVSADGSQMVFSGNFTSVGGSNDPGYGLARVSTSTGAMLPLPINHIFRDSGANSSVLRVASDGTSFYGVGWHYGSGGTSEGTFKASWADGSMTWLEDCHGDTYDVAPVGDVVYTASHKHYCGNSDGFPQTSPTWTFHQSVAFSNSVQGTNTADIYGYPDHPGTPRPAVLPWFPLTAVGSYTGQSQAVWTVTGNSQYVLYGGEFPSVNGTAQQGIVRYAVRSVAPNKQGPRLQAGMTAFTPTVRSLAAGTARISWPGLWDRDDSKLTYQVYRTDTNTKVYEVTQDARFWETKPMFFTDTGRTPGSTVRYRVRVLDPSGNTLDSGWVSVTISSGDQLGTYGQSVLGDGASKYWRLDDTSGSSADWSGADDGLTGTGVTRGTAGSLLNSADAASTFNGTSDGLVASNELIPGPQTFSVEAWFKTTTSSGKIVGFGNAQTGTSSNYDRHIYLDDGRVVFGVYPGSAQTLSSGTGFSDGQWHYVVGTLSSSGMALFVDGKRVSSAAGVTSAQAYNGYWRVGGDTSWAGNSWFTGGIDEVAVYPTALTAAQVNAHWVASGRTSTIQAAPADAYGAAVYAQSPVSYWRLDEAGGSTAADAGPSGNAGDVQNGPSQGVPGVLGGHTAYSFDGADDVVVAKNPSSNPTNYSEAIWFKTTTTNGGKLIGFGNAASGTSSNYDRHLYMRNDGTLQFGVWTGSENNIVSPLAYNNGAWHFAVATQSTSDGMKLYVDGQLVGTNPQTSSQAYDGYWRIGGDTLWEESNSPFFQGTLDEAAVFDSVLSSATVGQLYAVGAGVNAKPNAAFTSSASGLVASFDGSGSSDSDGSVASYAWDFGDGGSATTQKPGHTYASGGSYTVTLTVTDDDGATDSVSHAVVVTAPPANQAPTAAFSSSTSNLTASFDGSGSNDPDGTIASYAWDFGDGGSATTQKPSHPYAVAGTYTVTLTVTDDDGATDSVSHTVVVTAPPANQAPTAAFTSSTSDLTASFDGSGSSDADGSVASYVWDFGDGGSATTQKPSHPYAVAGTYTVKLTVTDDDGATGSVTHQVAVTAPPVNLLALDDFNRTVTGGWGTAEAGGAWTNRNGTAAARSVAGGVGRLSVANGAFLYQDLNSVSSTSSLVTTEFSVDKLLEGTYLGITGRQVGANSYVARLRFQADGGVRLYLLRNNDTQVGTLLQVPITIVPGTHYKLALQVSGTSPTTVSAKVWAASAAEPAAWQRTATDNTAGFQTAGAVGLFSYLPTSVGGGPLAASFYSFGATTP